MSPCVLYSTEDCHLCELAEAELQPLLAQGLQVEVVDISESAELVERYGLRIPVLRWPATEAELGWPFTSAQIAHWLNQQLGF
ncbi:glutaredoxin family protein [Atopomonas sediminilitoris]|uniref:glutaredoxin family protein n=1 Tax=Atopomonas sediminilitoris TaxID=2919919 RepID=UPI001F4DF699|nr:glutaredoxin family protein [Atopomonas sediminilitoris]MCJ8170862.1 glutaredoxin family protein [Atopomonas sediminilitoris]